MSALDKVDHFIMGVSPRLATKWITSTVTHSRLPYRQHKHTKECTLVAVMVVVAHRHLAVLRLSPWTSRTFRLVRPASSTDVNGCASIVVDLAIAFPGKRPCLTDVNGVSIEPSNSESPCAISENDAPRVEMEDLPQERSVIDASVCAMELRLDKVQVYGDNLLFVEAGVQGRRLKMLIDSGATHSIVRRDLLAAPAGTQDERIQARAFEGRVSVTASRKFTLDMSEYAEDEDFHLDVVADDGNTKTDVKVENLVKEFADYLREELPEGLPPERDIEHSVQLKPGAVPSSRPPFRHAHVEKAALQVFIDKLLRKKWIERSSSPWVSYNFAVPKRDPVTGELPSKIQWVRGGDPSKPVGWVIGTAT
ncbi:unnamed protein product [Phytophthora lilii]|uniref:Unnamed protein product n=1 Tax=Phytophthora lilii TaxID=2077276 RepID=A0A9W6YEX4_9STRA|nr:unnamed protein product [Phytophthora lilii]